MVVVGALGHEIAGAGLPIPVRQGFGIEMLRLPEGADVLVAELRRVTVVPQVVFILRGAFDVHIAGVPVPEHGYALGAPMANFASRNHSGAE